MALDPRTYPLPADPTLAEVAGEVGGTGLADTVRVSTVIVRIRDDRGRLAGTASFAKPAVGMNTVSALISNADLDHLDRMQIVSKAARRPAAILFADIEGSTTLSRQLSTLYVGSIVTSGRSEVTALGDEVNESARTEACATGGRTLASKSLVERLDVGDAAALGIEPDRIGYTILRDLPTASEKARRDAPAIAVCEL